MQIAPARSLALLHHIWSRYFLKIFMCLSSQLKWTPVSSIARRSSSADIHFKIRCNYPAGGTKTSVSLCERARDTKKNKRNHFRGGNINIHGDMKWRKVLALFEIHWQVRKVVQSRHCVQNLLWEEEEQLINSTIKILYYKSKPCIQNFTAVIKYYKLKYSFWRVASVRKLKERGKEGIRNRMKERET